MYSSTSKKSSLDELKLPAILDYHERPVTGGLETKVSEQLRDGTNVVSVKLALLTERIEENPTHGRTTHLNEKLV